MRLRRVATRWQRVVGLVLLLLILLFCGANYVSGKLAFKALDNEVNRLNERITVSPWLFGGQRTKLTVVRDRSGVFSSDWHLEWRDAAYDASQQSTANSVISHHKLYHGPFPWSAIKQGLWTPFLAHDYFTSAWVSGQTLLAFNLAGKSWGDIIPEAGNFQVQWRVSDDWTQRALTQVDTAVELEEAVLVQWSENPKVQKQLQRGVKVLVNAGLVTRQNQRLQLMAQVFPQQERIVVNGKEVSLAALTMLGMGLLLP